MSPPRRASPSSILTPAWDNQTSTVTPIGSSPTATTTSRRRPAAIHRDPSARQRHHPARCDELQPTTASAATAKVLPNGKPEPGISTTTTSTAPTKRLRQPRPQPRSHPSSNNYATTYSYYPDSGSGETATTPASIREGRHPASADRSLPARAAETDQQHRPPRRTRRSTTPPDNPSRQASKPEPSSSCYEPEGHLIATENTTTEAGTRPSTAMTPPATSSRNHTAATGDESPAPSATATTKPDDSPKPSSQRCPRDLTYDEDGDITQRVADTTTFSSGPTPPRPTATTTPTNSPAKPTPPGTPTTTTTTAAATSRHPVPEQHLQLGRHQSARRNHRCLNENPVGRRKAPRPARRPARRSPIPTTSKPRRRTDRPDTNQRLGRRHGGRGRGVQQSRSSR